VPSILNPARVAIDSERVLLATMYAVQRSQPSVPKTWSKTMHAIAGVIHPGSPA